MADESPEAAPILPGRLREAREYIGFTVAAAAAALGWATADLEGLEAGGTTITGEQARKLSRLYRRPVAWFRGETRFQPSPDLLYKVEHLHPGDREAVLDFAEYLEGAAQFPKPEGGRQ